MDSYGILQIAIYFGLLLVLTKPVGLFLAKVFQGERTFLHPLIRPLERLTYRLCGIREDAEQRWTQYAASLISFSLVSFLFAYVIQRLQGHLPLNPQNFGTPVMTPDLAFNTAVSFVTNTNW
ncbi:MAG TPA: potassium-transporting ATPase subunit KdpA, partial [Bryobacteraceae bacterium]|nr:potassium-transporting ATPase subunit KdpA [Bryobacteraceae bacterium]